MHTQDLRQGSYLSLWLLDTQVGFGGTVGRRVPPSLYPLLRGILRVGERKGGRMPSAPLPTQFPKQGAGLSFVLFPLKEALRMQPALPSRQMSQRRTVLESKEQFAALLISTGGNLEWAEPVPASGARSLGDGFAGTIYTATCLHMVVTLWWCLFLLVLYFRWCG